MQAQAVGTWRRAAVTIVVVAAVLLLMMTGVAGLQNEPAGHLRQEGAAVPRSNTSAGSDLSTEDTMYITIEENDPGPFPKFLETIGVEDADLLLWLQGAGADQPPVGLFVLDGPSGHLSVTAPLDREHTAGFQLRLRASSSDGNTSHSLWIAVTVADQNDNAPRFLWRELTAYVPRSAAPGTLVTVVQADDADDPETLYGQVSYSLAGPGPGSLAALIFTINASTGAVHMQRTLNRTDGDVFVLEVTARDCRGAELGRSDTARVTVLITDSVSTAITTATTAATRPRAPEPQEDGSVVLLSVRGPRGRGAAGGGGGRCPLFSPDVVNVKIREELPAGQILLNIRAANNSQIDELRLEGDRAGWLSVDALTGEVVTRAPLDRESPHVVNDTYLVTVVATTNVSVAGAGGCTGSVALLLRLQDVNDHAPQPSPPLLRLCQVPAYGDATLSATDADGPGNGAPFTFRVLPADARDGGGDNDDDGWTLAQPNGSVAVLLQRASPLRLGEHSLAVSVCDRRALCRRTNVGIVVRACEPATVTASAVALPIVLGVTGILALVTALLCCARLRARSKMMGL